MLDMFFPGMSQHRLKDARLEIVGLVPPEGARGMLTNAGVSWTRVPTSRALGSRRCHDHGRGHRPACRGALFIRRTTSYVMKRSRSTVAVLALSQFERPKRIGRCWPRRKAC